jgi:hypothetical protein
MATMSLAAPDFFSAMDHFQTDFHMAAVSDSDASFHTVSEIFYYSVHHNGPSVYRLLDEGTIFDLSEGFENMDHDYHNRWATQVTILEVFYRDWEVKVNLGLLNRTDQTN